VTTEGTQKLKQKATRQGQKKAPLRAATGEGGTQAMTGEATQDMTGEGRRAALRP